MKITLELNREQEKALKAHAATRGREPAEDLLAVWWGRTQALIDYAEKLVSKSAKFRTYVPKLLPEKEREKLKESAISVGDRYLKPKPKSMKGPPRMRNKNRDKQLEGELHVKKAKGKAIVLQKETAPSRKIDLYDSPGVALSKARTIASKTGKVWKDVLKENGRNAEGQPLKKGAV